MSGRVHISGLTIGIDALAWDDPRGYGRHLREIVRALVALDSPHRFRLAVEASLPLEVLPHGPAVRLTRVASAGRGLGGLRSARGLVRVSRLWTDRTLDVVFYPSPLTFVPSWPARPSVIALHDVIGHRFPGMVFESRGQAAAWRMKVRLAIRQASRIVAVSEHARTSLAGHLGLDPARLAIVGEAPADAFSAPRDEAAIAEVRRRFDLAAGAPVVVYHGAVTGHKNVIALIRAVHRIAAGGRSGDVVLVIAGMPPTMKDAEQHRQAAGAGPARVIFAGRLPDTQLVALLHAATVAALPSLDEGLGLTGLEAAAAGVPLVATRMSAMPELLGDAALYFDPCSETAVVEALGRLLEDVELREDLSRRARERAAAMTWPAAARALLPVLEAAARR